MTTHHKIYPLIIVGSGPAGLTAAIYAGRAKLSPLVIEGKSPGGQLMGTSYIENWPGEESILGPTLMAKIKDHAKKFGAEFLSQEIVRVDFSQRPFKLFTHKDKELLADSIIITTGAMPKRLQIPGENEYWGKGVTTCAVCDGAFYHNKKVMIVGGGDTAMEDASFMTKFTDDITVVQILDKLTACAMMQERILNNPKIKVIYSTKATEILGNGSHVTDITLENTKTGKSETVAVDGVFVAIGLNPSSHPFKGHIATTDYGYIKIHDHTKTSVEGIFAAGDVVDERYRQAITSAGMGCMAALDAERYLANLK